MNKFGGEPFVSRLRPPTPSTRILQPQNRTQEEPISRVQAVRRPLSRRSKSVADLRQNVKSNTVDHLTLIAKSKVKPTSTANLHRFNKPAVLNNVDNKSRACKRPAATVANDIKPKMPKPSKPAPYDYKARFGLLSEKHSTLVETHKEMKLKFNTYEQEIEYNKNLKIDYEKLNKEHLKLKLVFEKLKDENLILAQDSRELQSLKQEHTALISNYTSISDQYRDSKTRIEVLGNKVNELTKETCEYKEFLQSHEEKRRLMHNEIQDLKGNIRVFCRIRPSLQSEEHRLLCNINCLEEDTLEIQKLQDLHSGKLEFNYDKVFDTKSTQEEVFQELSHLVQSALDGYHVCIFAYGQTGSGKTYTMQGESDEHHQGMIPRTVNLIFELKSKLEKLGWVYTVEASFLEIYNETIKDLLNRNNQQNLEIRFNQGHGTTVTNLTIRNVNTAKELHSLMILANRNRSTAATNFNEHSSRSHAVTRITIKGTNQNMQNCYFGSLNLVDLAGSESAKNSERMVETKSINKSLSTLGTVMSALHSKESHIPYRNSKLTYLLQSCLGGNSKTLMFVNIAPFEECFGESVNSLRFAAKVKQVKLGFKRNKRQN